MGSIVQPRPSSMHLLDVFNGLEHCTKTSAMIPHQHLSGNENSGNENSQYPTKTFGFSVAGKWPTPFIAWCFPPVIFSQVAWPISGVLLQSYSPVNMYTGHFLVSMLDMRLRPSHPPAKSVSQYFPSSESHSPRIVCYRRRSCIRGEVEAYCASVSFLFILVGRLPDAIPEIHIQVTVENAVRLRGVQMPDELSVCQRRGWRHHLGQLA